MSKKQTKLTAFVVKKSNEIPSQKGIRKNRKINMNVLVNVNLKSKFGRKDAETFYFVSDITDTQSSSITSRAHSSTSATVCTENEAIDATTVNLNLTLNVTADTQSSGK